MPDSINPFALLKLLSQRVAERASPILKRSHRDDFWQAVAFQLADAAMLINMNAVTEVFPQPPVTRLPGVKHWVRGIANVRGEVLAIVDLHELFELGGSRNPTFNRVISIAQGDTHLGVVVDRIIGMRLVTTQQIQQEASGECPESMKPCVSGAVLIDGHWMDIFDPKKLITSENFSNVSTLNSATTG